MRRAGRRRGVATSVAAARSMLLTAAFTLIPLEEKLYMMHII
jgi:hypothetical protein